MIPISIELILGVVLGGMILIVGGVILYRRKPRKLKADQFADQWKQLQQYCRVKETWPQALIEADKLLDTALKKRRYTGKSMGERMVSAQRTFTNNDAVWFAHNLCKKVLTDPEARLKESDVKDALVGFRQALRDIGALQNGESRKS